MENKEIITKEEITSGLDDAISLLKQVREDLEAARKENDALIYQNSVLQSKIDELKKELAGKVESNE